MKMHPHLILFSLLFNLKVAGQILITQAGEGINAITDGLKATDVRLDRVDNFCRDSNGNIYMIDYEQISPYRMRLFKIDGQTGLITKLSTGGSGYIDQPGLSVDDSGNLYYASHYLGEANIDGIYTANTEGIYKMDLATQVSTLILPYTFTDLQFSYQCDGRGRYCTCMFQVDASGNIYLISKYWIKKYDVTARTLITLVGISDYHYDQNIYYVPYYPAGKPGFSGDGGLATNALFNTIGRIAINPEGDIFIPDTFNSRIRKVNASTGIINTIAGTGVNGYKGDGGLALNAELSSPNQVGIDDDGNIYFTDIGSSTFIIRKIDAVTNVISTVQGGGQSSRMRPANGVVANSTSRISWTIRDMKIYNSKIYVSAIDPTAAVTSPHYSSIYKIDQGTGHFVITDTAPTFDGTGKSASVTVTPANLNYTVSYNGIPSLPVNAGTYVVEANLNDPNYNPLTVTGSLTIAKANAIIQLTGTGSYGFDGVVKSVFATTMPAGLLVDISYNGSLTPPSRPGSYIIRASVNDANYQGSISSLLTITKAQQTITFSLPAVKAFGDADFSLNATSSSGLPITYNSSDTLIASVSGNTLTIKKSGTVTITASQSGDSFYFPTPDISQMLVVLARATLICGKSHGAKSTEVLVPIKANSFSNILSSQFSVSWDSTVATYVGIEQFGLAGMDASSFGTSQTSSGRLGLSWSALSLQPQTLQDGSTLFVVRLKLTGNFGDSTLVKVTNQPVDIELVDKDYDAIAITAADGTVKINDKSMISGKVLYPNNEAVRSVSVQLQDISLNKQSILTDTLGNYQFKVALPGKYTITPDKRNDPEKLNGIDVQDVAAIRRHILKTALLSSPYQIIAADVSQNDKVSTLDIDLVQAVILGIRNFFTNDKQWMFVPQDFQFNDPQNPFPYPHLVTFTSPVTDVTQNFIGMKLGDVNNSRDNSQSNREQQARAVVFEIGSSRQHEDGTLDIPIRVKGYKDVSAYQFTLSWDTDKLSYQGTIMGTAIARFGEQAIQQGQLTTVWDQENGQSETSGDGTVIFTIRFLKKSEVVSNKDVSITSTITPTRVYDVNLKALTMVPAYEEEGEDITEGSYPNPFDDKITIVFNQESEGEATIVIMDVLGKRVRELRGQFGKGSNTLTWDGKDSMGAEVSSGIYLYKISSKVKTGKMVKY